eukprot:8528244-Karenia_brevis.AAC.1
MQSGPCNQSRQISASLGKWATTGNAGIHATGSWATQVLASLGKWATTSNSAIQATGSCARQV